MFLVCSISNTHLKITANRWLGALFIPNQLGAIAVAGHFTRKTNTIKVQNFNFSFQCL